MNINISGKWIAAIIACVVIVAGFFLWKGTDKMDTMSPLPPGGLHPKHAAPHLGTANH